MLDDFLVEQNVVYNIMKNSIISKKYSHAYLINTNGYPKGFDMALAFAKCILCPYNKSNLNGCEKCNQCNLIDNNVFPELKVLENDGVWIKKEQTDELQVEFSKTSVGASQKVYIINGVENLNLAAANSILKFLEEPVPGIMAILVTDNIYKVLGTIISRCQIFNLNSVLVKCDNMVKNVANYVFNDSSKISAFLDDANSVNIINRSVDFLIYLESNGVDTLVYIDSLWNCFFSTKEDYLLAFDVMLIFYNDILNCKMDKELILCDYKDLVFDYALMDYDKINLRINLLIEFKNRLYSNVNLGLLMDKFIIEMGSLHD